MGSLGAPRGPVLKKIKRILLENRYFRAPGGPPGGPPGDLRATSEPGEPPGGPQRPKRAPRGPSGGPPGERGERGEEGKKTGGRKKKARAAKPPQNKKIYIQKLPINRFCGAILYIYIINIHNI